MPEVWPWLAINDELRQKAEQIYSATVDAANHYSLEVYIYDIMTHPESCLTTDDPEQAKLFYVPHLSTLFYRYGGMKLLKRYTKFPPWARAIHGATEGNFTDWARYFGLTGKYWKRNSGTDHILVMPQSCSGFEIIMPMRCGNDVFFGSQRQASSPIVVSHELTQSFASLLPHCTKKNIIMPYANIDGRWFNGEWDRQAAQIRRDVFNHQGITGDGGDSNDNSSRPRLVYMSIGIHGQCRLFRKTLVENQKCLLWEKHNTDQEVLAPLNASWHRAIHMRLSRFCICPAGDSASARRMYDAVVSGCIPVILSTDFIWAHTTDNHFNISIGQDDASSSNGAVTGSIDPSAFSIWLNSSDFDKPLFNEDCDRFRRLKRRGLITVEEWLAKVPESEVKRLQQGLKEVAPLFSFYSANKSLPLNPLADHILADGGAIHRLLHSLALRTTVDASITWEACAKEAVLYHDALPKRTRC